MSSCRRVATSLPYTHMTSRPLTKVVATQKDSFQSASYEKSFIQEISRLCLPQLRRTGIVFIPLVLGIFKHPFQRLRHVSAITTTPPHYVYFQEHHFFFLAMTIPRYTNISHMLNTLIRRRNLLPQTGFRSIQSGRLKLG